MPKQDISIKRDDYQNQILDLEKHYFNELHELFKSQEFQHDLLLIEKEISERYPIYKDKWDLKNKIKIPAERLVRHHIYKRFINEIKGIYPSPISSDLGLLFEKCVLCVDVKTLDTISNSGDISTTAVEPNQISFNNENHPHIKPKTSLESIDHYKRVPVLTYIIKIIYTDNNYSFKLSRENKPSLVLACIPNGELSFLFGKDIIKNYKTYSYYKPKKDGQYYEPILIDKSIKGKEQINEFLDNLCKEKEWSRVPKMKTLLWDSKTQVIWRQTTNNLKRGVFAVKSGSTARLDNKILQERYDSENQQWSGYVTISIPEPLL